MSSRALDIIIGAKGVNSVIAAFASVSGSVKHFASEVIGISAILEAGPIGAFETIVEGFKKVFEETAEGEQSVTGLREALKLAGDTTASTLDHFKEFANEIQKITTLTDDAVLKAGQLGASMGGFVGQQLEDVTKAAIGLSEKLQIDLPQAMELVVKAGAGFDAALAKRGIRLDENATQQERFNQLLKLGADAFPLATAKAQTMGGALTVFKNQIGDVAKTIGESFRPALTSVIQKLGDFAEYVAEAVPLIIEKIKSGFAIVYDAVVPVFVTVFNEVTPIVIELGNVIVAEAEAMWGFWSSVWQAMAEVVGTAFNSIRGYLPSWEEVKTTILVGLTILEFGWKRVGDVISLIVLESATKVFEWRDRLAYSFEYVTEFLGRALLDSFEFLKTFLTNAGTNISNFLSAVSSWLHGDGFDFKWTGLVDGFKSAWDELGPIADMQFSETTKALQDATKTMEDDLSAGLSDAINKRLEESKTAANRVKDFFRDFKLPELGGGDKAKEGDAFNKSKEVLDKKDSGSASEKNTATAEQSPFLTGIAQASRETALSLQQRQADLAKQQLDQGAQIAKNTKAAQDKLDKIVEVMEAAFGSPIFVG